MNIVYIDMQNVHLSTLEMGRTVDRKLFYDYLKKKFEIDSAKIFVGYIERYESMYQRWRDIGYEIIYKEVLVYTHNGQKKVKGDVDIDIAIQAMKDIHTGDVSQTYLVTGDADYNTLIYEWREIGVRGRLLVPNLTKTLYILRKASASSLQPLSDIKHIIQKKD